MVSLHSSIAQVDSSTVQMLDLETVISETIERNYQIRVAKNNSEIAANNHTIGNAGMLPVINATANFSAGSQNADLEFANGETQVRNGASRQSINTGLNMTWTLFDGTRMFATMDRLENEAVLGTKEFQQQLDNTLSNTLQLFYQVALEQERLELFRSNVTFSQERVRIVDNKYQVGKESKLSLLQAKVDLNTDQSSLIQQQELLAAQKLNLLQLMGVAPFNFDLEYQMTIDSLMSLEEVLQGSLINNPQLSSQMINQKITENQLQELNRARLPEIDFNLGYGYSELESEAGFLFRNQTTDLNYGFSARLGLFNGFNQTRQIQNTRLQLENQQLLVEELQQQLQILVLTTFTSYTNNLSLRQLERENLKVAQENSEIAIERFRLGVSDALELREAQINAVNAQIRFLQAQFNAKIAEIELKRLAGRISKVEG